MLDQKAIAGIRAAFMAKRHAHVAAAIKGAPLTLGAAIEIASWLHDPRQNDAEGRRLMEVAGGEPVAEALSLLRSEEACSRMIGSAGRAELSTVSELTTSDRRWWDFLMRFAEAIVAENVSDASYAKALAQSLHEMADNVRQHSAGEGEPATAAIAGWHTFRGVAAFAVADLGMGIRASLSINEDNGAIGNDRDALVAVVCRNATRKRENRFGDGYKTVVQNFVSRNGSLSVRSGTAELLAVGNIVEGNVTVTSCPMIEGTRVGAWCAPRAGISRNEPTL